MPALMIGLLLLLVCAPLFGRDANGKPVGPIFFSTTGPGSQHAPLLIALAAGLLIGFLAQRSRFCTVGALRDLILMRDAHLFLGIVALLGAAFVSNLALGQFKPGFTGQPVAHTDALWNFGGMVLAGLAFIPIPVNETMPGLANLQNCGILMPLLPGGVYHGNHECGGCRDPDRRRLQSGSL
jgi:YedE family putative selenium metabolism protein